MFHRIRQVRAGAISCSAADHSVGVRDLNRVFGVDVRKHAAFINQVVPTLRLPPLYCISPCLMKCGQLHQAEIGPPMTVHVQNCDIQFMDTSFVSALSYLYQCAAKIPLATLPVLNRLKHSSTV